MLLADRWGLPPYRGGYGRGLFDGDDISRCAPRARSEILIARNPLVPVLLGMAAIAVDIGSYADDTADLHKRC